MREDNPLTARVAVNRWWAELFGNGIVATLEDFGTQAEPPTHPELLDWLAVEFMESGWDMKHLLKTIVMSNAYRQSSKITPEHLAKDPRNLLLARAPRFRMDAERLRDNALAVSGLLSTRMHGKPIMPYQPPGLWRQTGRNEPKYKAATDADRFRRGIYVIWRRAAPYPSFVMFDGPDRAACHPMRSRTNTPMQALTLMNDRAYVEAALGLARRGLETRAASVSDAAAVERVFRMALSRRPLAIEVRHLAGVLAHERRRFTADPRAAASLVRAGGAIGIEGGTEVDTVALAAWFHVATILLNLDEVITKG